jgi:hypothetical protein
VGYLYDECEPAERAAIDAHLALCAACAAEIAALGSARLHLASWSPPEADLGFAIVRPHQDLKPQNVSTGRWGVRSGPWFSRSLPAWAQAVAACLIFGAGLSLGVIRGTTSIQAPTERAATETAAAATTATPVAVAATDLAALESRLRAEMTQLRGTVLNASGAPQSAGDGQLLAQVRALIDESEQRQQRELALRTQQIFRDFESQRRVDLARIESNFGQIEGLTGAQAREQQQMLNLLMRVSEQR